MSELSQVERQLRSWIPRQPSAALKARIFGAEITVEEPENRDARRVPAWQWLAPAMAVFLVVMMSWTDGARTFISSAAIDESSALGNPELAAYYSRTHSEHNAWPVATFDWTSTNDRQSLSAAAAPVLATNSTSP